MGGLLEAVLEAGSAGVIVLNAGAEIVYCNSRAAEIVGRDVEWLTGRSILDDPFTLRDAAGRPVLDGRNQPRQLFERGRSVLTGVVQVARGDGTRVWVDARVTPVFSQPNGPLEWMVASFHGTDLDAGQVHDARTVVRAQLLTALFEASATPGAGGLDPLAAFAARAAGQIGELVAIHARGSDGTLRIAASGTSRPELQALVESTGRLPPLAFSQGISGRVAALDVPIVSNDFESVIQELPHQWQSVLAGSGLTSVASLPAHWNGSLMGTLTIGRTRRDDPFVDEELDWLRICAGATALTLTASSRQGEWHDSERRAGLLELIARTGASLAGRALLLETTARQLVGLPGIDAAAIHIFNDARDAVYLAAAHGFRGDGIRQPVESSTSYLLQVANEGRRVSVRDLRSAADSDRTMLAKDEHFITYDAVPIRVGPFVHGVVETFSRVPDPATSGTIELLEAVAAVIGLSLELTRAEQEHTDEHPSAVVMGGGSPLTPSELRIVKLVAQGLSNAEVAGQIHLGPDTVKYHLHTLYRRLGVGNRAQLVGLAIKRGWV